MKYRSLRVRIIAAIIATWVAVAVFFGAVLYPFEKRRREARLENVQFLLSSIFQQREEQMANEIFAGQREAILQSIEEMQQVEGVSAIAVYRLNGLLMHSTAAMAYSVLSDAERRALGQDPTFHREKTRDGTQAVFTSLIEVYGEKVGYIKIYFDLSDLEKESDLAMLFFTALLVSILLLMSLLLNIMLSRMVIRPVSLLREAMGRVQAGRFGDRVDLVSRDEIGEMAGAFNEMSTQLKRSDQDLTESLAAQGRYAAKLEETNRELERLNTDLENMVAERTRELLESNSQLMEEIDERTRAEADLETERERLAVTLGSIGDGVISTDTEGRILIINLAAESMTGWTRSQARERLFTDVFQVISEEGGTRTPDPLLSAAREGIRLTSIRPRTLVDRVGGRRIVSYSLAPIRDADRTAIGAVLVFRDVTEQMRYEREFLKSAKLESLGILAGGIAHDFNNVMTAILGNLSLARQYCPPEGKAKEKLLEAERATLHAKGLTRQLLTFSKGGAPVKATTSIGQMLKDTASFALAGSNLACEFRIAPDLWPADIDSSQISQVINNLVINAKQAMPEGGEIEIRAENRVFQETDEYLPVAPGRYIAITVKDEGVGIPEDRLPKIFDPYFTTKDWGSGLGLSTSYSIIRNHGGHIDVESKPDQGATFFVYLPAADRREEGPSGQADRIVRGKSRILVMDDEQDILEVVREFLELLGYQVKTARDGQETIEKYVEAIKAGRPFQAVIMDLTIPGGLGGQEAIRALRDVDPGVKAIVASGYSQDPVMSEYRQFGFSGVLTKPFRLEELSQVLARVIEG